MPTCWEIDEFFEEAARSGPGSELYSEARRIYWEAYWRLAGRYKRGRRFFDVYVVRDTLLEPYRGDEEFVLRNILVAGFTHGIVPREALEYTTRIYRELFGPIAKR